MLDTTNRFTISHRGPAKGAAYEQWREGIGRGFCQLDVGPTLDDYIDCHNEFTQLSTVAMAKPKGRSARFGRTRDLLNDSCDDLVLILASRGTVRVTQQAQSFAVPEGQMCLTEMNVVGDADLSDLGAFVSARFSRAALLQLAPKAETQVARPLAHAPALRHMIHRYFDMSADMAGDLDAVAQRAAAQHLTELVAMLLGADPELTQQGAADARLDLLKADILNQLDRCDLSYDAIARANGMSGRQAQRLFAREGTSFSEFVLEQRLLLARRLLREALERPRKISDVALSSGFSDLSYFNRAFRKRFGATPGEVMRGG